MISYPLSVISLAWLEIRFLQKIVAKFVYPRNSLYSDVKFVYPRNRRSATAFRCTGLG